MKIPTSTEPTQGPGAGNAVNSTLALLEHVSDRSIGCACPERAHFLQTCGSLCGLREMNQDTAFCCALQMHDAGPLAVFGVADGMGGQPHGDIASREAAWAALSTILGNALRPAWDQTRRRVMSCLEHAMEAANQWLLRYADSYPECRGMGTTLSMALAIDDRLYTAHAGDSRLYLYRDGRPEQLTRDDSYPWSLVECELLTPEEAESHPTNHVITRYIGDPNGLDPIRVGVWNLAPGDAVLAVTDGVWKDGRHALDAFHKLLLKAPFKQASLDTAVRTLLQNALEAGADDNLSAAALWMAPATSVLDDSTQPNVNPMEE